MATSSEELAARLLEVAGGPASVSGDAGAVTQHDLKDLLELAKYLDAKQAVDKGPSRGMRITRLVPPGAV